MNQYTLKILMSVTSIVLILGLSGCGYSNTELAGEDGQGGLGNPGNPNGSIGFDAVKTSVFDPHCISCHSPAGGNRAGINLSTYASAKLVASAASRAVSSGSMPLRGPLSTDLKNLLAAWVQAGAPEVGNGGSAPPPTSPAPPNPPSQDDDDDHDDRNIIAPPDFATIKTQIIDVACIQCHSASGRPRGGIKLDTFADVQPNAQLILKLVKSGIMPPREPLSPERIALLEAWVLAGTPEFVVPSSFASTGFEAVVFDTSLKVFRKQNHN